MKEITYDPRHEAYVIEYSLWGKDAAVLFFTEDKQEILDNIKEISEKLDRVDRNRGKIASILIRDGWYRHYGINALTDETEFAESLSISEVSVWFEEDGAVMDFYIARDGCGTLILEMGEDSGLEITGWTD